MQAAPWTIRRLTVGATLLIALTASFVFGHMTGGSQAAAKHRAHASNAVTYAQRTFQLSGANEKRRLVVRCPGQLVPLGGGMTSSPAPPSPREGNYPHSYEPLRGPQGY